eukprot:c12173_g1_i1 orf=266-3235(+)
MKRLTLPCHRSIAGLAASSCVPCRTCIVLSPRSEKEFVSCCISSRNHISRSSLRRQATTEWLKSSSWISRRALFSQGLAGELARVTCTVAAEPIAKEEEMAKETPKEIFLKDYKQPDYFFEAVQLNFVLGQERTIVHSTISVHSRQEGSHAPLKLDGVDVKLLSLKVNGEDVKDDGYTISSRQLVLLHPPSTTFKLEIATEIEPQNNTTLEGLYKTTGTFCTQCEAEGFRRITYYQDRPDVMAKFTTRIEADKSLYPVLLSNGNLIEQGDLSEGRHYVIWEDPFKKPCYLFALVAGELASRDDVFTTCSGRKVSLRIWTPAQDVTKTAHAMYSLKAAMKWDEEVFGREYDLDLFNIVAVPDFNMGAMENKSLNIFNSRLVLASPETASDADYAAILGVIGHEYFHNWTGNRVTCRDWFQLSLKEGLTVFRDQEFSSDMGCRAVKRIADVVRLRISQFPQDAGPMSHPVRPHSYIKMDNFYTVTVYEKGAEVVRMYQTLLSKEGFRKGMDLYFERHDGQAVTCDDFYAAMRDANSANLANFALWYSQSGTPVLTVDTSYNPAAQTFQIKCRQEVPATPGQPTKEPMLIPLAIGLLGSNGQDLSLTSVYDGEILKSLKGEGGNGVTTVVLRVEKAEQEFVFTDIPERPVPSLLRSFSAPVRLVSDLTDDNLLFLLAHDSDEFNRWEAGQTMARKLILSLVSNVQNGEKLAVSDDFLNGLRSILCDSILDKEFIAKAITLPAESELMDLMEVADPDAVHTARRFVVKEIASSLRQEFLDAVTNNRSNEVYAFNHESMARRALKNVALGYLASLNEHETTQLALNEYNTATNMTEQIAGLAAIAQNDGDLRTEVLSKFYEQWKKDSLVTNKWLALQAMSDIPGNVKNVKSLLEHPAFDIKNPNKVYSLVGGFCGSSVNFHAKDGSGYQFLGDMVLQLDKINPQVASRMVSAFSKWKKFDSHRQKLAKEQLDRIAKADGISDNVYEIASKSLAA